MISFPSAVVALMLSAALIENSVVGFSSARRVAKKAKNMRTGTSLAMAPKYDIASGRWMPAKPEEETKAGYSSIGSLLRQGPVPFIQRLKDPDQYDQAVLKYMANSDTPISRDEAQGNMDAYLLNPNDWALQKFEEKKGAPTYDYANANMEDDSLILTGAWAGILLTLVGRIAYVSAFGCDEFCRQYHW